MEQALRAAKSHERIGDDFPAGGRDLDCLPERVAQVEVDVVAIASDPDVHRALGPVEERPAHQNVERIAKGLASSGSTEGLVEPTGQPCSKCFRSEGPDLVMAVTLDAGIRNIVRCVEELDVTREFKELRRLRSLPARCRLGGPPVASSGFASDVSTGPWLRRSRPRASRPLAFDVRTHASERRFGPQRLRTSTSSSPHSSACASPRTSSRSSPATVSSPIAMATHSALRR